MIAFIKENFKMLICVTVALIISFALIGTNEILAEVLPDIQEATLLSYEMEVSTLSYTGKEQKPVIKSVSFENEDGTVITKKAKDIYVQSYLNNIDCGYISAEITVSGYHGTRLLENICKIQPAQVTGLQVVQTDRQVIDITWSPIFGASGYYLYKSSDGGANYTVIGDIKADAALHYQDLDVQLNAAYMYYVSGYISNKVNSLGDFEIFEGQASESTIQYTPLATPILAPVQNVSYTSNKLQWGAVEGAVGYQVFRSDANKEEYTCIAELTDGGITSYTDATCECGRSYSYYIKACQLVNAEKIYGDPSGVHVVKTLPNRVGLAGNTTNDDTAVTLGWKKSLGASGYEIYRSQGSTKNYQLIADIGNPDTLGWAESGLDKKTVYYYRIRPYCIVDGQRIVGSYSGSYEKVVTIVYNYSDIPGELAAILKYAQGSTKVQYVWGGTTLSGWDCSGFTQWVFRNHFGIEIGRTAAAQNRAGVAVNKKDPSSWKPGDLLIYTEGAGASHVAIYLGNGQLIHALSTKYDTLIQDVDYYERWDRATSLMAVRRIFK